MKPTLEDVKNKRCVQCKDTHVSSTKYEGYCLRCYMYTFRNKPVARGYKIKEVAAPDYYACSRTISGRRTNASRTAAPSADWICSCIWDVR